MTEAPKNSVKDTHKDMVALSKTWFPFPVVLCLLQGLIFCFTYPRFYTIYDEAVYLSMSYLFMRGKVFGDGYNSLIGAMHISGHAVFKYAPGLPLMLVPLVLINWAYCFIANFLLFCFGGVIFASILRLLRIRAFWAVLYFFFPPFVLYSRTLMSDIGGMVAILASFYYCLRLRTQDTATNSFKAGIFLGITVMFRWANAMAIPVFTGWLLLSRRLRPAFAAGCATILIVLATYWMFVFKSISNMPYLREPVSLTYMPQHLPIYLFVLLLVYPGLAASLFLKGKDTPPLFIAFMTGLLVCFYSCYHFIQGGTNSWPAALVAASRFILPAQALLLAHYAGVLDRIWDKVLVERPNFKRLSKVAVVFALICGTGLSLLISVIHAERCKTYRSMADDVRAKLLQEVLILCDDEAVKCLNPFWSDSRQAIAGVGSVRNLSLSLGSINRAISHLALSYDVGSIQLVTLRRPASVLRNEQKDDLEWGDRLFAGFQSAITVLDKQYNDYHVMIKNSSAKRFLSAERD